MSLRKNVLRTDESASAQVCGAVTVSMFDARLNAAGMPLPAAPFPETVLAA